MRARSPTTAQAATCMMSLPLLVALTASQGFAAELVDLQTHGDPARMIDLVLVAEGYTAEEREVFIEDAKKLTAAVLDFGPYAPLRALVNARGLFMASKQSGADHPSEKRYVNSRFDSTFDTNGIKRLLTADDGKVLAAVNDTWAEWDLIVVVVNDSQYGGSGGAVPVVSTHAQSIDILRHELAHTIGGVADEYEAPYPGKPVQDPEPNVALHKHLYPLKWSHWLTPGTPIPTSIDLQLGPHAPVGAYEGARYQAKGMYRPTPTCIMRALSSGFCPVCSEAVTVGMAQQVNAVAAGFPASRSVSCGRRGCPALRVDVQGLKPQQLRARWRVDGEVAQDGADLHFLAAGLAVGAHTVEVDVLLTLPSIRNPPGGVSVGDWQWNVTVNAAAAADGGSAGADDLTQPPAANSSCASTATTGRSGSSQAAWLIMMVLAALRASRRRA